jgi:hypothetical protein
VGTSAVTSAVAWVRRRRLAAQHLDASAGRSPGEVVRELLAVQAQDVEPSWWSVAMRTPTATCAEVRRCLDGGEILRTHVLRPTWHLVHRDDLRWLLRLTASRVHARNGHRYRALDLDPATLAQGHRVLNAVLDGTSATRPELGRDLAAAGIDATGQRLAHLLMHAELDQLICSGPLRGNQHTYALFDQRVPAGRPSLDEDEALGRLAARFVAGHGPATAADLRSWASLTVAQTRRAVEMAGDRLRTLTVDDTEVHCLAAESQASVPAVPPTPRAHLLQPYDEYLSGAGGSRHWIDPDRQTADHGRRLHGDVLIDGVLRGTWRRRLRRGEVDVELALPPSLGRRAGEAVADAVQRYGAYQRLPVAIATATPPAR